MMLLKQVVRYDYIGRRIMSRSFHNTILHMKNSSNNAMLYDLASSVKKGSDKFKTNDKLFKPSLNYSNKRPNNLKSKGDDRLGYRKKKILINWGTGTERAKNAMNNVISNIFKINNKGYINIVNEETNRIEVANIRDFAKGLDLTKHGLNIVNIEERNNKDKIPLVKVIDINTVLRKYSDQLAKEKEQELKELGVLKKKPVEKPKGDNNLKHISITWQIEKSDLNNQKAKEIISLLRRGNKVNLYISDRNNSSSGNWLESFEGLDEQINSNPKVIPKKEVKRRNDLIDFITEIFFEYSNSPVVEGSISHKMILKLVPKVEVVSKTDFKALKEERRRERQAKLEKRIARKKHREDSAH